LIRCVVVFSLFFLRRFNKTIIARRDDGSSSLFPIQFWRLPSCHFIDARKQERKKLTPRGAIFFPNKK